MKIYKYKQLSDSEKQQILKRNGGQDWSAIQQLIADIFKQIREKSDSALGKYRVKFDQVTPDQALNFKVTKAEIASAYQKIDDNFLPNFKLAYQNILKVATTQKKYFTASPPCQPSKGIQVWQKFSPIEKIGIYIPGGLAPLVSTVLMTVVPAQVAGCSEIVVVTPPQKDNSVSPYILAALDLLGITTIYKVGGAQAIASLALGTTSIPQVYKIFGPGNSYVQIAKLYALSQGLTSIDLPAGPSEVMVLADDSSNPNFVAADLLADIEHGLDSVAILVTTSDTMATKVQTAITTLINQQSEQIKKRLELTLQSTSFILVCPSKEEMITFANAFAPEHLLIQTTKPESWAKQITNAGSVYIGNLTCKASGDYATGANHVLPTGGYAKTYSALSVLDFMKITEYQTLNQMGFDKIAEALKYFATIENLPNHYQSVQIRKELL